MIYICFFNVYQLSYKYFNRRKYAENDQEMLYFVKACDYLAYEVA